MLEKIPSSTKEDPQQQRALLELNTLGLNFDCLKNKLVLDIGAGKGNISREAKKRGSNVISLDKEPELWSLEKKDLTDIHYVKALGEKLPFPDDTFDLIISHAGPFVITPSKEILYKVFAEAVRVLKKNGELRFGPGNLNANIFTSPELFSSEEQESFTRQQRIQRIEQRSLELLKELAPQITQQNNSRKEYNRPNYFYLFKKEE